MLAVFLLIPFLLIRFPLLSHFGKNALSRAAYFAPVQGKEKIAYMIYQLSNLALFIISFFLEINFHSSVFFYAGSGYLPVWFGFVCYQYEGFR